MTWSWQEVYNAARIEGDPDSRRERLVTAEKAIVQRIQQLSDGADDASEARALRAALDSLYAQFSQAKNPPAELAGYTEVEPHSSTWLRTAAYAAAGLLLSFLTGSLITTRIAEHRTQRMRARTEVNGPVSRSVDIIAEPIDNPPSGREPATTPPDKFANQTILHIPAPLANAPHPVMPPSTRGNTERENPRPLSPLPRPTTPSPALENSITSPDHPNESAASSQRLADALPPTVLRTPNLSRADAITMTPDLQSSPPIPRGFVSVVIGTYPSIYVPPQVKSAASRGGASLHIGKLIFRVDPIYPQQAEREAIEGTVTLRAIVGTDGAVQSVGVTKGPAELAPAATSAVRQWRYQPTLLGDQPIAVVREITVTFGLTGIIPK